MSDYFNDILSKSKKASSAMSKLNAEDRSKILMNISGFLLSKKSEILEANQLDVERATSNNVSSPMINRLILTSEKIDQLSKDVEKIAQMQDPLNQILENWTNPSNGLKFSKVSVPIGIIGGRHARSRAVRHGRAPPHRDGADAPMRCLSSPRG